MTKITIVRSDIDASMSVYRGNVFLGRIYAPTTDHADWIVAPVDAEQDHGYTCEHAALIQLTA